MNNRFRTTGVRRRVARWINTLAIIWAVALVVPCIMAATAAEAEDPCPDCDRNGPELTEYCGRTASDCRLPVSAIPLSVAPEAPVYAAVPLAVLSIGDPRAVRNVRAAYRAGAAPLSGRPPPYLEFAVLLL